MSNKQLHTKTISIEIKAKGDGQFTGYASTFGNIDLYGDIVAPGAFKRSLDTRGPDKVKMLWQHNSEQVIGIWKGIKEDDHGLFVEGALNLGTQLGKEAYALLEQGALDSMSIGFTTNQEEMDNNTGIRTLKEVKLWEISLVTFPANEMAEVTAVKTIFEALDQKQRVETIKFINNLKSSPEQTSVSPLSEENHTEAAQPDTKDSDSLELEQLKHSLEQLRKAIQMK